MKAIGQNCPSRFALERWIFEKQGQPELKEHIDSCVHCRTLAVEIQNERKAFLVQKPFSSFYPAVERVMAKKGFPLWNHPLMRWVPLGGLVLLIFFVARFDNVIRDRGEIRLKGTPEVGFFIREGDESKQGKRIQKVKAGDRIRLYTNSGPYSYVVILGVEEDGTINRYYPDRGGRSFPVPPGKFQLFPDSIVLDESPNSELFLAIFSKQPLEADKLEKQVANEAALFKKEGKSVRDWNASLLEYPQSTFYLEKE